MAYSRLFADMSNNNPNGDFRTYHQAGHLLVALKTSEGVTEVDSTHRNRALSAHSAGLLVVHYHYLTFGTTSTGDAQAAHFWANAKPTLGPHDRLMVDFEPAASVPANTARERCVAFTKALHAKSGRLPILYTGEYNLKSYGDALAVPTQRVWVANYSDAPAHGEWYSQWWAWQMSGGNQGPPPHQLPGLPVTDVNLLSDETFAAFSDLADANHGRLS